MGQHQPQKGMVHGLGGSRNGRPFYQDGDYLLKMQLNFDWIRSINPTYKLDDCKEAIQMKCDRHGHQGSVGMHYSMSASRLAKHSLHLDRYMLQNLYPARSFARNINSRPYAAQRPPNAKSKPANHNAPRPAGFAAIAGYDTIARR